MHAFIRPLAGALVAVAAIATSPEIDARPYGRGGSHHAGPGGWHGGARTWAPGHGHHHARRGWYGPSVALGVGVGVGLGLGWGTYVYPGHVYPGHLYPRHGYYYPGAVPAWPATVVQPSAEPVVPALPSPPEPVIYPNHRQSPEQTELDRRECDRWALTQPHAVADASVFHRATTACMEGRGYTVR